ncbi:hypothetical protein [Dickeya oryzae]
MFIFAFIGSFWPGSLLTLLCVLPLLIWLIVRVIQLLIVVFEWQWKNTAAMIGTFFVICHGYADLLE